MPMDLLPTHGFRSRSWLGDASNGVARFPLTAAMIAAFSALANLELADRLPFSHSTPLLAALLSAAAVSLAVSIAAEARGISSPIRVILALAIAGPLAWSIGAAGAPPIRVTAMVWAALAGAVLLPFVGRGSPERFWAFTLWTVVGAAVAFVAVALFLLAGYVILWMLEALFGLDIGGNWDRYVLVTGLTLIGPLFALGRIPSSLDVSLVFDATDRMVRVVRPLFDWVLVPLVLVAGTILHVYLLREAAGHRLTTAEVWPPLVFSVLVMALRVAIDPFRIGAPKPTTLFLRFWRLMLALPTVALGAIIWQRVETGGWMLASYGLAAWSLSLALVLALAVWRRAAGDIRWLVGVPALLLLLTTFGPWSVESTVVRSQLARLSEATGHRAEGRALVQEDMASLRDGIADLGLLRRLRDVRGVLPPEGAGDPIWQNETIRAFEVMRVAGIDMPTSRASAVPTFNGFQLFAASRNGEGLDLADFDLALRIRYSSFEAGQATDNSDAWMVALTEDGQGLSIRHGSVVDRVGLEPVLAELLRLAPAIDGPPQRADLTSDDGRRIRLDVDQAGIDTRARVFNGLGATILVRRAEWKAE